MQGFLTKAFTAAHDAVNAIFQKTTELCDYVSVLGCRLIMDRDFLHIDPKAAKNDLEKGALFLYELGRQSAIKKVNGTLKDSMDNPHGGPKPSIKDILKDAVEAALPHMMKPNIYVPVLMGLTATIMGVMMYTMNTGHLPNIIDDLLAPFMGSGAGSTVHDTTTKPPEP